MPYPIIHSGHSVLVDQMELLIFGIMNHVHDSKRSTIGEDVSEISSTSISPFNSNVLSHFLLAVTATSFSHTGQYLAYSVGYDWSKGHNGNVATVPNKVYIHTCLVSFFFSVLFLP